MRVLTAIDARSDVDRLAELAVVARRGLGGGGEERRVERAAEPLGGVLGRRGTARVRVSNAPAQASARSTAASAPARCRRAAARRRASCRRPPLGASGMAVGSASSSRTCWRCRAAAGTCRRAGRARVSAADGGGGSATTRRDVRSTGGGSAASRSKSRNCSDICTPPSPSVIVWCIFWIERRLAAAQALDDDELPQRPGAVERVGDDQRGQVEQLAHACRAWAGRCGARGGRCRSRDRRPTSAPRG